MKKIFAIIFGASLTLSIFTFSGVSASAAVNISKPQVGYLKRKTKKVYYRTKNGTKYVAHKTKKNGKAVGCKTNTVARKLT